ncbi:hypothetical protein [Heliothis virescens ascovirus 3g]|uniref:Uncharacterized protein n=1 Tax=Heliothis virescens ascovirus 3g TaxID=1246651 RepID=K4NY41_9VIRU|nr:hypothetical protein F8204_gp078 [Heliothis virescens ascovirus 3g]AFV50330.1 hypothetical protein [Heliothis virescens ascovirus 3g]
MVRRPLVEQLSSIFKKSKKPPLLLDMDKSLNSNCFKIKKPHLLPLFETLNSSDVEAYELLEHMVTTKCTCVKHGAPDIYCGCSTDLEQTRQLLLRSSKRSEVSDTTALAGV